MKSDALNEKIWNIICSINDTIPQNKDIDLLDEGYINSFDVVNMISILEDSFDIEIAPEDIVPENFRTIKRIASLISHNMQQNAN